MGKIKTTCECGGSYDGTPSGLKRHEASAAHRQFLTEAVFVGTNEAIAESANGGRPFAELAAEQDAITAAATAVLTSPEFRASADAMVAAAEAVDVEPITAPDPYAPIPELSEAYTRQHDVKAAIASANKSLKEAEAGLRWRQKHNADNAELIAKWNEKVNRLVEQINLWDRELGTIALTIETARAARLDESRTFWDRIGAEVEEQFVAPVQDAALRFGGNEYLTLFLTTGKVLTNRDGDEYPEERFGFDVTIKGPATNLGSGEAATLNWGSIGQMTADTARDMLRLHTLAVEITDYLNKRIVVTSRED